MQPGLSSLYVYSRDNLAYPLRLVDEMLAAVVSGSFVPDATRSGRFTALPKIPSNSPGAEDEWMDPEEVKRTSLWIPKRQERWNL
jgi:hypothetical protein